MTKKKDPYISELDELTDLSAAEEPTRTDLEPAPAPSKEAPKTVPKEATQPLMDLAPDIPVQVVVVMGRKEVTVKDLLALRMGQVVELDRAPKEAVDLVAAGRVIAKGELVEIEGKLGVRIVRIVS